jgi:hypothetical protein
MPLGSETPTVLGEGMVQPSAKRKRPVNQLPSLQDYDMPVDPQSRIKKPKTRVDGSIPTVLDY